MTSQQSYSTAIAGPKPGPSSHYRPDVDGLRAIAVLAVLLYHVGVPFVPGGYVGVDIFFVISGFVITSRILDDIANDRFSIAQFYERRIRRILPALAVTLLATLLAFSLLMDAEQFMDLSRSLTASTLSVSNFFFWKSSGYFDPSAGTRPLLHTWSLSVEEQFYLFIPVLMQVAMVRSSRLAKLLLVAGCIASFALSVFMTHRAASANFYLLPTRAWELLIGSLLAIHPLRPALRPIVAQAIGGVGLACLAIPILFYASHTPFPGLSAALPTAGTALLIAIGGCQITPATRATLVTRALSSVPMIAIGAVSYSLYLVHWPVITFTRYLLLQEPGFVAGVVVCATSLALATLSWRFIENPIRRPKNPVRRPMLFAATAVLIGALSLTGYLAALLGRPATDPWGTWGSGVCFLLDQPVAAWKRDRCRLTTGASRNALLWGDSFAAHYAPGLARNSDRLDVNIMQITAAACPPIFSFRSYALPHCHGVNQAVLDIIKSNDIKVVFLSARWDMVRARGLEGLSSTIDTLSDMGLEVYVIGVSPIFAFDPRYLAYRKAGFGPEGDARWTIAGESWETNKALKALVGKTATFIDPLDFLCPDRVCTYLRQGRFVYLDYKGHFSDYGSDLAVQAYFPLLRRRNGE